MTDPKLGPGFENVENLRPGQNVPDTDKNLKDLFSNIRFDIGLSELEEWDIRRLEYLCGETVRKFCGRQQMTSTLEKF